MASPRLGQFGAKHDLAGGGEVPRRAAPGHALVRDPYAERNRQDREHAQVAGDRIGVRLGVRRRRRLDEQPAPAEPPADFEHRLRDVHLVGVEAPVQPLEIAQHLEARHPQAALAHRAHAGIDAGRMADDVAGRDHHLREAGAAHRGQLHLQRAGERRRVHPEVAEDHRGAAAGAGSSCTSSNITLPSDAVVRAPRSLA